MALTEIRGKHVIQKRGAWRERGENGYHVSDDFRPNYEQMFFRYLKGLF